MNIGYLDVLGRAWARSKAMLFGPAVLDKWMALGFTAWLATLGESSSSVTRFVFDRDGDDYDRHHGDFSDWANDTATSVQDFFASGVEVVLWSVLLCAAILIALLVTWLSSRGHFLLLDNVVHNRSRVAEPWSRLAHLGDSLFLWRLLFGAAMVVIIGGGALATLLVVVPLTAVTEGGGAPVAILVLLGFVLLGIGLLTAFIEMCLYHFVVPLMYRYNIGVVAAWRSFLSLLRREPVHFVLYALFLFLIYIVFGLAVVVFGFATCCVGFVAMMVLAIPVIGSVLVLPWHVTGRSLGPEFMAQFGPEFVILEPLSRDGDENVRGDIESS